jgi:WD40 repeat protein/transcriptional regulator with XRE-family HTH domain
MTAISLPYESFQTFGDLLKYLRRRERLTQLELSISVGYSEAQISRLEQNQRLPDLAALKAVFIPALHLENEPELTARLLHLAQSARQEDAPVAGVPPYKGLLFFDQSDADLFFGRETLTRHLANRTTDLATDTSSRFLAIVGASGSGKSSLVRAGLAVMLQRSGWEVHIFTPTTSPLKMLAANDNSTHAKDGKRHLILVDQFEETFTLCRDENERAAFVERLLSIARDISEKTTVVIALRADFYSHCAQYPLLREAVAAEQEYIGQMTNEELRRAIEEPAKHGGWEFEHGLVDLLLNDIGADGTGQPEPGALPLLSHALLATWERRRGRTFTVAGYRASGGVRGAIAETAESVFNDQLNRSQQNLARGIFLRLTELGEGTEDTRRRAGLNELAHRSEETVQLRTVLNLLADARLITLNEDSAEVAHEALIREWERLHEWLSQDREGLRLHRHLTESAHEWEARGYDAAELYRGARLAQMREWTSSNEEGLNASERGFITASIEHEKHEKLEREAQQQRELEAAQKLAETERRSAVNLRTRNRVITTVGTIALILALLAGTFGVRSNQNGVRAEANFKQAEAQRLALEANRLLTAGGSSEQIALLSLRSMNTQYTPQGDAAVVAAAGLNIPQQFFIGHFDGILPVVFSPDGKYILTGSWDKTARLWDAQTGREVRQFIGHTANIWTAAFSPDGRYILTGSWDETSRLWDAKTGKEIHQFIGGNAAYFPDGKVVLTYSADETVRLWDAATGLELQMFVAPTNTIIYWVAISPDGKYVLTASDDGIARLWDIQTNREVRQFIGHTSTVAVIIFSPDGRSILTGSYDGTARLWDAATGKELQTYMGHTNNVNSVAFSSDGKYVFTASSDSTARVWNSRSGRELQRFTCPKGVTGVAISPDGKTVLTGSEDGIARLWSIKPKAELPLFNNASGIAAVAFSSDGRYVLTGGVDGIARLWDAASGQKLRDFIGHKDIINFGAVFSPDDKYILTGSWDNTARLWDVQTGKEVRQFIGHTNGVNDVAFVPDGKHIVTASSDGTVRLWDAETGQEARQLQAGGLVFRVAFSPDGKYMVTASGGGDGKARLWDISTYELLRQFDGRSSYVLSAAFSPDGTYLLTSSNDNIARLWNVQTGEEIRPFIGHTDVVSSSIFSPDGRYVATASMDSTARLWDMQTGQELRRFVGHTAGVENVAFSLDGKYLLTGSDDGTARLWNLDYHATMRYLCSILLRDFTDEERKQYNIMDNTPTCPQNQNSPSAP